MLERLEGSDACSGAEMKQHLILLSRMPGQFLNHCCATDSLATQHDRLKKKCEWAPPLQSLCGFWSIFYYFKYRAIHLFCGFQNPSKTTVKARDGMQRGPPLRCKRCTGPTRWHVTDTESPSHVEHPTVWNHNLGYWMEDYFFFLHHWLFKRKESNFCDTSRYLICTNWNHDFSISMYTHSIHTHTRVKIWRFGTNNNVKRLTNSLHSQRTWWSEWSYFILNRLHRENNLHPMLHALNTTQLVNY